jgi:hypothetical protein
MEKNRLLNIESILGARGGSARFDNDCEVSLQITRHTSAPR